VNGAMVDRAGCAETNAAAGGAEEKDLLES